MLVKNF